MILFVSGATGGHIYPAIALAHQLNNEIQFVVSRKDPAQQILAPYGYSVKVMPWTLRKLLKLPIIVAQIIIMMVVNRPKVVVAMGGGICVPFAYIAWLLRIPVVSLEQNVVPGKATRYIQWVAASIITSFAETNHHLIKKHAQFLGEPT